MRKNQLSIRLHGEPMGILEQTASGKMMFTYDASATQAISMSMPIREEAYGEVHSEAYFGGLLPESETVRKIIGKKYGISHNNSFSLLKAIGHDCAGAISCHATDDPVSAKRSFPLTAKKITDDELYQHIKELPKNPLFMDVDGLRLSLAGAQDKAAICVVDNQIALPQDGCPTTHILKPTSTYFEGMAENEYFCLQLARHMNLSIPTIELRKIKDITFLLIERYDRRIQNGHVERIHQEDFCQALGILSTKKYQNEGGPSFKDCFNLLKNTNHPAIDRNKLLSAVLFNYFICNMDAHGKNFSLLHHAQDNIQLAPFYDILCTRVYGKLTTRMAMKIGTKYDPSYMLLRHWEQFSNDIAYRFPILQNLIKTTANTILNAAEEEREKLMARQFNTTIIDKIIKTIQENIKKTLARL